MRGGAIALGVALLAAACSPAAPATAPGASATPSAAPTTSPLPAQSASATVPPSTASCGQEIRANFTLANDLTCPKDGLLVVADNVTLDLGGRTLTGPGSGEQTWPLPNLTSVGVKVVGRRNVTIRNGRLVAFATNILLDGASGNLVEEITSERSRYGIYINGTDKSTFRKLNIHTNTYGLHLQKANDNQVLDNQLVRQTYNSPGGYGLYAFSSRGNRIVGNTIESNLNWGVWFSDARGNTFFHNNVVGNNPQVSDNIGENSWHDPATKEGNYWSDYGGRDRDGDGIGDTPYQIGGPGNLVDPYPFVERDGWKRKTSQTIDHYAPPPPKPPRDVKIVALADGGVVTASPSDPSVSAVRVRASSIALATDQRTLYALDGRDLAVLDAVSGEEQGRFPVALEGAVVANRDGRRAIVIGSAGARSVDVRSAQQQAFTYRDFARDVAPSWKHNILFVSTERGIDIFYLGKGGNVPYTIPLDGPGGALAMNRSGTRIYAVARGSGLVDVIDTEQYQTVDRLSVPWEALALAVSPDERVLYVAGREGLLALELPSGSSPRLVRFAGTPVDVAASPNGDELYVALDGAERGIAVLRTSDLERANFIRVEGSVARVLVATY